MKRSHQLLIACVALVAALVLFFWPRSTAAAPPTAVAHLAAPASEAAPRDDFEQRCLQQMRPSIRVSASTPTFVLNDNVSTRILSTRSRYASGTLSVMGMTASRTLADISIDGAAMLDADGARECIAPRIEVLLSFQPLDVYVAREFNRHSCAYRAVLEHEMEHVRIYAEQLARIERLIHGELVRRYDRPLYAAAGKGVDTLHSQINGWLDPMIREELNKVETLQARLDTPEQTDRLSHACLGEVAYMMGSSF
jgi:hypothetical protein